MVLEITIYMFHKSYILFFGVTIVSLLSKTAYSQLEDVSSKDNTGVEHDTTNRKTLMLFKTIFKETRLEQINAVKSILAYEKYEKQYKITYKVFEKVFEVMTSSKSIIENSDYILGLDLPKNSVTYEALVCIIDNTAMYAEFQLKLPDITDRIMKSHQEWLVLIKWGIGFSNATSLLDEKTTQLIYLLCQEMNLTEREANYFNPYRKYDVKVVEQRSSAPSQKQKLKTTKGPRMSKPKHIEL